MKVSIKMENLNKLIEFAEFLKELNISQKKQNYSGFKIVRTYSAGVFAGYIESRNGQEVIMRDARRLWRWAGAASLSQLAVDGTKLPNECKFPCSVPKVELLEVIEILDCTEKAKESILNVPVWEA